jgi:hypothetical protein
MGGYSRYNVLTRLLLGAMEVERRTLIRLCDIYIVNLFWQDPEITNLPQYSFLHPTSAGSIVRDSIAFSGYSELLFQKENKSDPPPPKFPRSFYRVS